MVLDLKPCVFEMEGDLGMQIQMLPSGGTVVLGVKEGSQAKEVGVKKGDVIRWPGAGGVEAPYHEVRGWVGAASEANEDV